MTLPGSNRIAVAVPLNAKNLRTVFHLPHGTDLVYEIGFIVDKELPPGQWQLCADTLNMTEEMAQTLVSMFYDIDGIPGWDDLNGGIWNRATPAFQSLLASAGLAMVNPYLHLGSEKPSGEVEVSYDKGINFDNHTEWVEKRTCMMAGSAGGHGYLGEGWATSIHSPTDTGLICDPPDYWVYTDQFELYEQSQSTLAERCVILEPK